jgi:predicted small integral membrane protein
MSTRSTFGWSLFTSGIVTLLLIALPGDSLWWGLGLTVVGLLALLGGGGSRY